MEKDSKFEHLKMKGHRYNILALVPKGCGAKSLLSPSVPTGLSDNAKKEGFPGCDSNLKLRLARQSDVAMWEFFADSYSMQNSGGV